MAITELADLRAVVEAEDERAFQAGQDCKELLAASFLHCFIARQVAEVYIGRIKVEERLRGVETLQDVGEVALLDANVLQAFSSALERLAD